MKRITYILLFASLLLPIALKAQTPYDSFAPEASRPMLEADASTTSPSESILCAIVADMQSQMLLLVNISNGEIVATTSITDDLRKWLSVDPLVDKNIAISPYMYCNGNPIIFVDPTGLDTLHFDSNGLYSGRIKSEGDHVGIIHNADGTERNFKFLNQADADRFCQEGSDEALEIKEPLFGVQLVSAKTINKLTLSSVFPGAVYSKRYQRMLYAGFSSLKDGRMDYSRTGEPIMKLGSSRGLVMMYLAEGSNYAQDSFNFGNMLWGQAMRQLRISPLTSLLGAQFFSLFIDNRHEFDPLDDQFSIILGYFYCITRHF